MEITCTRCHQPVEADACYCPSCGLPQLVYSTEEMEEQIAAQGATAPVRDAGSVDWKLALRTALTLGVPAGILCSMLSPVSIFGLLLMGGTGAWAVTVYLRKEKPAWMTIGAGARIGLVTGLLGAWTAAAATGAETATRLAGDCLAAPPRLTINLGGGRGGPAGPGPPAGRWGRSCSSM